MAKQQQPLQPHQHDRGTITDNALKAVVTSKLFTTRVVKAKKGKGSYRRRKVSPDFSTYHTSCV